MLSTQQRFLAASTLPARFRCEATMPTNLSSPRCVKAPGSRGGVYRESSGGRIRYDARKRPKNESIFAVDSLEKALFLLDVIRLIRLERSTTKQFYGLITGLKYLFSQHPELRNCTHQYIADLIASSRDSVARVYKHTWE
jgi:hypothetical protein